MNFSDLHDIIQEAQFMYLNPKMRGGLFRKGTKEEIKELQEWLNDNNYDAGPVDGIYGRKTAMAVKKFQKDAGLRVDGDAGKNTIRAMEKWIAKPKVPVNPFMIGTGTHRKPDKKIDKPVVPQTPWEKEKEKEKTKPLSVGFDKEKEVLDLIAQPESSGRYDAIYPNKVRPDITSMTLNELFRDMRRRIKKYGGSASGRYQYIYETLRGLVRQMGLDPDKTVFNKETQDEIALYHLKNQHRLDKFLNGQITSAKFLKLLAGTWAGLPEPDTNMSRYQGVGDNKSNVDATDVLAKLDQIQNV